MAVTLKIRKLLCYLESENYGNHCCFSQLPNSPEAGDWLANRESTGKTHVGQSTRTCRHAGGERTALTATLASKSSYRASHWQN